MENGKWRGFSSQGVPLFHASSSKTKLVEVYGRESNRTLAVGVGSETVRPTKGDWTMQGQIGIDSVTVEVNVG